MSQRRVQVVILCEDKQHSVFVRRYMKGLGYGNRQIRQLPIPCGKGAAEQYVRKQYPTEVQAYRKASKRRSSALMTVIDADTRTVEDRHKQLASELKKRRVAQRAENEPIVILVPRRNIETWIHYLLGNLGNRIDETKSYPKLKCQGDCHPAVKRLLEIRETGWDLPDDCPPSLERGCDELKRLEPG